MENDIRVNHRMSKEQHRELKVLLAKNGDTFQKLYDVAIKMYLQGELKLNKEGQ